MHRKRRIKRDPLFGSSRWGKLCCGVEGVSGWKGREEKGREGMGREGK